MPELSLHHVSVPTRDLEKSSWFYEVVLGLTRIPRPGFQVDGIWYGIGRNHIHLVVHETASFRTGKGVDNDDIHFAIRTDDFEASYAHFKSLGFDEQLPLDHPQRMIVKRTGLAGFPQIFLMDPARNIIEINQAPFLE
jgi:glyoxylase I family protein